MNWTRVLVIALIATVIFTVPMVSIDFAVHTLIGKAAFYVNPILNVIWALTLGKRLVLWLLQWFKV